MADGGTHITQGGHPDFGDELLPVLYEQVGAVPSTLDAAKDITLPRAAATYIMFKRRRLTTSSERGYRAVLDAFTIDHPGAMLGDFEPPRGTILVEDFLTERWGDRAPRTYNKSLSVLCDFFSWHVGRGTLTRDPMATIERAKARPVHRTTFTEDQCYRILAANPAPRDQIALRLLLYYGLRKGALRAIRLEHFDHVARRLVVFTKGETIHTLPIPEATIWDLLGLFDEPGAHYLLPKRTTRKRTPPRRKDLDRATAALADVRVSLEVAADDDVCARELDGLFESLELTEARLGLTVEAASTQERYDLAQPIGEHGAHLWWYRCLARAGVVVRGATSGQRMHKARHTTGQRVLDTTGNLKAAQAVLMHATIGTTGDIYTGWEIHQTEQTLRDVVPAAREKTTA